MYTASGSIRLNITLSREIIEYLNENTKSISKYISEMISERMAREKRLRAMKSLQQLPPAFPDIDDATSHVRALRAQGKERDKRLGIL